MTEEATRPEENLAAMVSNGARIALLIGGLISIGFGIAVLVWPAHVAVALTGVIALYAILAGLVYVAIGLISKKLSLGGRVGHVLLGILYVLAGVFAFSSLKQSAAFLAVFLTIMVGVMWIVEGFTALFTLGESKSKGITIVFSIISVLAGFSLLTGPLWSAVFLWWLIGISMLVLGLLNVIRALVGRKR